MTPADIQARIDATKAIIIAYEDAITALITNGVQSYTLDTGQTTQTVTKFNINGLQRTLDSLYNRCIMLQARLDGSNSLTARPAW